MSRAGSLVQKLWARAERRLLFAVLLVAGLLLGFLEIADGVDEGDLQDLDEAAILALRDPSDPSDPLGPRWLEEVMRDVTSFGSTGILVLITLGMALYLLLRRSVLAALFLLGAVGGGQALSLALKAGFSRPRPSLVPHHTDIYTSSFPSGHSMMAALTWLTLAALVSRVEQRPEVKLYLVAVAVGIMVLVGFSRVYLGVHYPTDVLAGWAVGALWAILAWLAQEWWVQRRLRAGRSTAGVEEARPGGGASGR